MTNAAIYIWPPVSRVAAFQEVLFLYIQGIPTCQAEPYKYRWQSNPPPSNPMCRMMLDGGIVTVDSCTG
jgi:hypothetical protein